MEEAIYIAKETEEENSTHEHPHPGWALEGMPNGASRPSEVDVTEAEKCEERNQNKHQGIVAEGGGKMAVQKMVRGTQSAAARALETGCGIEEALRVIPRGFGREKKQNEPCKYPNEKKRAHVKEQPFLRV